MSPSESLRNRQLTRAQYLSLYQQSPPRSPSVSEYGDVEQTMVPGTLRGYREWTPTPEGLLAMNFSLNWDPGVNTATCIHGYMHTAPNSECTCGFYAKHLPVISSVSGVIKASGTVILGTLGFRAQYAEIEALYLHGCYADDHWVFTQYNVPIYTDFDAMVRHFPPISVRHLLPEPEPKFQPDWRIPLTGALIPVDPARIEELERLFEDATIYRRLDIEAEQSE